MMCEEKRQEKDYGHGEGKFPASKGAAAKVLQKVFKAK